MTKPIDLSRFHAFLDPRLAADALIQGILDQQLRHIQTMIEEAHTNNLSEFSVNASGMDRDLISKVLEQTSPYVAFIKREETELHIKLKTTHLGTQKVIWPALPACLYERAVAVWPLASPDESDPQAQRRHLGVLERLLADIWRAAQEKKQSFLFQAIGYDRRLLARATLLIVPQGSVTFEKVVETNLTGLMRIAIQSTASIRDFDIILPFVQPKSRMENDATPPYRRSRHTSSNQQASPCTSEQPTSKITPENLQFVEAYTHYWLERDNKSHPPDDFNIDPILLRHLRLGFESALASDDITQIEIKTIQEILRKLETVEGALSSIERIEGPLKVIIARALSPTVFPPLLQELQDENFKEARDSALQRREIEIRFYKIPNNFFIGKPAISTIEIEQVARSYWPKDGGQPVAHILANQTVIIPRPTSTTNDIAHRRNHFYKDLLTTLAQASQIKVDFAQLLQSLQDLKNRDFNSHETQLLTLLRAGSFSTFGHADNFLRTHLLNNLPKNFSIKAISNPSGNRITFSFEDPLNCLATRKALYALIGPKREPVATFILQSDIVVKPGPQFEMTVSIPIFDAEGQITFKERIELYKLINKIMPKSS